MCAGTNNEAIRYVFVQRGQDGRGTVVHCHRSIDTLTNLFVPGDIALWNWAFNHSDLLVPFEGLEKLDGIGCIRQGSVEVQIQLELRGHIFDDG